jgi:hypothetical protein
MREVVIQSWCDECLAEGVKVVGEQIDVQRNGSVWSLDLCEAHSAPFREVDRIVALHGKKNPAKKWKPAAKANTGSSPHICDICGKAFSSPQGLNLHGYRVHREAAA